MSGAVDYFLAGPDGRIACVGRCPERALAAQARQGLTAHLGAADPATQYFDRAAGKLASRRSWPAPDKLVIRATGDDVTRIDGVPAGSLCVLTGPAGMQSWAERDAWIEITANVAGRYTLTIDPPRHLPATVRIEALP